MIGRGRWWTVLAATAGVTLLVGLARAQDASDLAIVKKAVAATPSASERAMAAPKDTASGTSKAKWLKVRVVEKGQKRVAINLPLALVRAMGDAPLHVFDCGRLFRGRETCSGRVRDLLRALEEGREDLVSVHDEDDDVTVRIWIE